MFYDDLKKYTEILGVSATRHDSSFDDVKDALQGIDNTDVRIETQPIGDRSRTVKLEISNPHGSFTLSYRYTSDFFLTLMCHVIVGQNRHAVRWWDDYEKFTYPDEEHRRTVYDFMRAVNAGF